MSTLLQLMALPAACLLVAWLRTASVDTMASLVRGATLAPAIARPTAPRLARVAHRMRSSALALGEGTPRSRRGRLGLRVRTGALTGGGCP